MYDAGFDLESSDKSTGIWMYLPEMRTSLWWFVEHQERNILPQVAGYF
jgi:hypothetical protein